MALEGLNKKGKEHVLPLRRILFGDLSYLLEY
jgi:hypothetical protein